MADRIVVAGASLAGLRGAQALRDEGYAGEVLVIGAEQHAPYRRPPLSKELAAGGQGAEFTAFAQADVDATFRLGRTIVRLDMPGRAVVLDDGARETFDALLIATGSTPRRLPGTEGLDGVHVLRTLDDALALMEALAGGPRVVVVGGGFIGCEVASGARARGLDVTLVTPQAHLMPALGERFSAVIDALHRDAGVDLRFGRGVSGVEGTGRAERVRLDDGSAIDADLVVVGIGVEPATGWLENTGLDVTNGVLCDVSLLAVGGGGDIAAAGDLARWPYPRYGNEPLRVEHWVNGVESAQHAARTLVHGVQAAGAYEPDLYFWTEQHGVHLQSVGQPGRGDDVVVLEGSLEARSFAAVVGRNGRAIGAVAIDQVSAFTNRCRQPVLEEAALAGLG